MLNASCQQHNWGSNNEIKNEACLSDLLWNGPYRFFIERTWSNHGDIPLSISDGNMLCLGWSMKLWNVELPKRNSRINRWIRISFGLVGLLYTVTWYRSSDSGVSWRAYAKHNNHSDRTLCVDSIRESHRTLASDFSKIGLVKRAAILLRQFSVWNLLSIAWRRSKSSYTTVIAWIAIDWNMSKSFRFKEAVGRLSKEEALSFPLLGSCVSIWAIASATTASQESAHIDRLSSVRISASHPLLGQTRPPKRFQKDDFYGYSHNRNHIYNRLNPLHLEWV